MFFFGYLYEFEAEFEEKKIWQDFRDNMEPIHKKTEDENFVSLPL
jgi:hypothetical protein